MNFFEHQDRARSTTRRLVLLFGLALVTLIVMTSCLIIGLFFVVENNATPSLGLSQQFLSSEIFLMVSLGVIVVVGLGSAYRFIQLRGGGKSVAESMGGRLLNVGSLDTDEQRILNVVEEMALAAGLPVPPVYLIEDLAINAFAAGYQAQDAVIGITRGCIQILSRDELQGVIAHEFSHIFNGDIRLNIRLMGLLYGIMVLGMIGYLIMRSSMYRSRGRNSKGSGVIFLGMGLVAIGYGGTFFGNMIKAGVSRQREFLADASAVQFTRNPEGIGGALKKIGAYSHGSRINNSGAAEISHMLFAQGLSSGFTGLFATHPPLQERILKIEPNWGGVFPDISNSTAESGGRSRGDATAAAQTSGFSPETSSGLHSASSPQSQTSFIDTVGSPTSEHIALAVNQLSRIPENVKEDAHSTFGASALMYSLIIRFSTEELASKQFGIMKAALSSEDYTELLIIYKKVEGMSRELFLPLVDLALPSLKQLSSLQYPTFMSYLSQLMVADENISLFEWSLFKILRYNLDQRSYFRAKQLNIKTMAIECSILLSALAEAGHENEAEAETSFNQARELLRLNSPISFDVKYSRNTKALEKAVDNLQYLKPLQKPMLLKAMVKCIDADGLVTPEERELLRAIASLLDCPIPPLLAGQRFI